METITIEKVIKFDNVVDSLQDIEVLNDLKYELYDDSTHASALINIKGKVKTVLNLSSFNEDVEVEIFTPYNKEIDKDKFNVVVKDYSYTINNNNLNVYLILKINGIVDKKESEEKYIEANYDEIVHSMNELNTINNDDLNTRTQIEDKLENNQNIELKQEEVKENKELKQNNSWANNLFKLTENYSVFKTFHVD